MKQLDNNKNSTLYIKNVYINTINYVIMKLKRKYPTQEEKAKRFTL